MAQTHFQILPLSDSTSPEKDVLVQLSANPIGKAIVFVHGFNGKPTETWADFHDLILRTPGFSGIDAIYYGYDGLRADLFASAAIFRTFLQGLATRPAGVLNPALASSMKRPSQFRYTKITLVCHSLGAVVARRAILDAADARERWARLTQMVLFAPAHKGASIVALAKSIVAGGWLGTVFSLVSTAARFTSPLIDQLDRKSPVLATLERDAVRLTRGKRNRYLCAKHVVIAQYEKIVDNSTFAGDPPPIAISGTNHMSVCKPKRNFLTPLQIVRSAL